MDELETFHLLKGKKKKKKTFGTIQINQFCTIINWELGMMQSVNCIPENHTKLGYKQYSPQHSGTFKH